MIWKIPQPIQAVNYAKIRGSVSRKHALRQSQGGTRPPFAGAWNRTKGHNAQWLWALSEEIRHVTHRSPQPLQQKPETETEPSRKGCGGASCLKNEPRPNIQGRLVRIFPVTTLPAETPHSTETDKRGQNERRAQTNTLQVATVWWKHSGANIHAPAGKRKDDSKDRVLNLGVEPQTSGPRATECYFQVLKSKIFFPTGFQKCLASVTPLFLPLSHFWNGNVCNCYPVPSLCLTSR